MVSIMWNSTSFCNEIGTRCTLTSDIVPVLSEVFLDIHATMECRFIDQNSKPLNIEDGIKVSRQTI